MKPSQLENALYIVGTLLIIGGAVLRIGHLASASLGYAVLLAGFVFGSAGRLFTAKRMRQLQARNQELEAQLADRSSS